MLETTQLKLDCIFSGRLFDVANMASIELRKRWRITTTLLKRARSAIEGASCEDVVQFCEIDKRFEEFIEHNELGLALDELEALGDLVPCRGGFWRDLERAATMMELKERAEYFRRRFLSTRPASKN